MVRILIVWSHKFAVMTELENCLKRYMDVADEDMQTLVAHFHPVTLEKGDYFLRAGRVCDKLCFHQSGLMRVFARHGDKEVTQWISSKGDLMSDLNGLICHEPAMFDVVALTHCELYT